VTIKGPTSIGSVTEVGSRAASDRINAESHVERSRELTSRTWRRLGATVVAVVAMNFMSVIGLASSALASPTPEQVDAQVRPSILLVGIEWQGTVTYPDTNGNAAQSATITADVVCTGWFASRQGDIVTAGHCVDPAEGKQYIIQQFLNDQVQQGNLTSAQADTLLPQAEQNWPVNGSTQGSPPDRLVRVVQTTDIRDRVVTTPTTVQVTDFKPFGDGDFALLQLPNPSEPTPALVMANSSPPAGAAITSVGYPGGVIALTDNPQVSFLSGTVSGEQNFHGSSFTEVNTNLSPGLSGGPAVNDDGEVVGTNSFMITNGNQNNFLTNGQALWRFLKDNNVSLVSAPAPAPKKSATGPPIGLLGAVAGAALLLVAGGVVLWLRRRHPPSLAPSPSSAQPVPATPLAGNLNGATCPRCRAPGAGGPYCSNCGLELHLVSNPDS
jgi:serine protease Do